MKFNSKTEMCTHAIFLLRHIQKIIKNEHQKLELQKSIENLKVLFENHKFEITELTDIVTATIKNASLNNIQSALLHGLIFNNQEKIGQPSAEVKFQNPLRRRFESEIAITHLFSPGAKSLEVVKHISNLIVEVLANRWNTLEKFKLTGKKLFSNPELLQENLIINNFLTELKDILMLDTMPNLPDIITLLKKSSEPNLAVILHIHYVFAKEAFRGLPVKNRPADVPVGKFLDILKTLYFNNYNTLSSSLAEQNKEVATWYFKEAISQPGWAFSHPGYMHREHICNYMNSSDLYTFERNKGRSRDNDDIKGSQYGLMQNSSDAVGLLKDPSYTWNSCAKSREPNFNSQYVIDMLENESLYISGPSGLTILYFNMMEILANFQSEDLKRHYFCAFASYIVSRGWHSWHELIGPAQYALNLFPNYKIAAPQKGKLADAPNYHIFFETMMAIDPNFSKNFNSAWDAYLTYFENNYLITYHPELAKLTLVQLALVQAFSDYKTCQETFDSSSNKAFIVFTPTVKQHAKILKFVIFCCKEESYENILASIRGFNKELQTFSLTSADRLFIANFLEGIQSNAIIHQEISEIFKNSNHPEVIRSVEVINSNLQHQPSESKSCLSSLL